MANSNRYTPKKSNSSTTVSKKRERRRVSHTSSVTSLTVLRQRLHHLTRWIFIFLGLVLVLGFGLSVPNIGSRRESSTGDVARIGRFRVQRDIFEGAVEQAKQSQFSFASGPAQEVALRHTVLEQIIDQRVKVLAARREGNKVGRKQLNDRIEQIVDSIIQQQKAYYKTDKDFREKYLAKRMKVSNEAELRAKLRSEQIRPELIQALREQILVENLENKVRKQAEGVSLDKVSPSDMEFHVRQIVIKTDKRPDAQAKTLAQQALDQVRAGADFATVAKAKSEDEMTKAKGGDLDWLGKGGIWQGPEFEKAVMALQPGQVSGLIKTRSGYYVAKVEGRRYNSNRYWADYIEKQKKRINVVVQDPVLQAFQTMMAPAANPAAQKQNHERAIVMFRKALQGSYPANIRAGVFYAIGNLYLQDNNLAKAAEAFGSATQESPSPELYLALGDAQRKLKQGKAALESYKKASEMASDTTSQMHYFTHAMLQNAYKEMKETQLAAVEKAWIDQYLKAQQGGFSLPGGSFTVR